MQYSIPHQMARRASQYQHSPPLAANLGLARPPAIYLTAIVTGLGLHFAWPIPFVPSLAMPFGALIAAFAVMLFIWSIRTFDSAGTPVPGNRSTTAIVRVGPYRFSRNPIYLAFSLFQTGIALGVNDAWILVTLLPARCVLRPRLSWQEPPQPIWKVTISLSFSRLLGAFFSTLLGIRELALSLCVPLRLHL
jgi:protein-S-isoprenylcysteine O-methyltransferase Ste14